MKLINGIDPPRKKRRKKKMSESHQQNSIKTSLVGLNLSSLTLFFFILFTNHGHFIQAHIFIYSGCSQERYQPNSLYETNLNSLLSSLVSSSYQSLYNEFAMGNDSSSPLEAATYGLYQCRGDLKAKDCSTCVSSLIREIVLVCPYTYGATLQQDGCLVRYEHIDFLGKPDTSLRYKKCSKSSSNDAEFLRRRDDILVDLQGAIGFRVSSSGSVEGYGQCVGDLNAMDCSSCLGDAVVKVKSLCGSAAAGDVFLAQCYVRYWESGYFDDSSASSDDDDMGKTVAIIVGVIAGVAILIVLLSFCRKALG